MNDNELSYLKGVGIRIHSVCYQKVRNRTVHKDNTNRDDDDNGRLSSREFLRLRGNVCHYFVFNQQVCALTDYIRPQPPKIEGKTLHGR